MAHFQTYGTPRKQKTRILLIQLEFPTWNKARSWSYAAQLGYEEGLVWNDITYLTIPAYWGVDSASSKSWLHHVKSICQDQRFDQVWVEIVHSKFDYAFLDWMTRAAPVRVGFIPESLEYTPEVYAFAPYLRTRKAEVEERLSCFTHVVAADERDVEDLNRRGVINATWWPAAVPSRCLSRKYTARPEARAVFYGELYGERTRWLSREDLAGLIIRPPSPEIGTPYPKRFDALHRTAQAHLASGKLVQKRHLDKYIAELRRIRQECFDLWLRGLQQGCAVVNLPHFISAYPGRIVEAIAAGVPVVSWEIPNRPRTRDLFRDGEEILLFPQDDPSRLADHIRRLQQDPELAKRLVANAQKAVGESHTIEKRVQDILAWIDETRSLLEDEPVESGTREQTGGDTIEKGGIHVAAIDPESPPSAAPSNHRGEDGVATTAPPSRISHAALAHEADVRGDIRTAADHYLQTVKENPQDVDAWVEVGKFAVGIQDEPAARTAFRRALLLDPSRQDVRELLQQYFPDEETAGTPKASGNETDAYYLDLFGRDPEWSAPHPNQDEAARWSKIVLFLNKISHVASGEGKPELRILDLGCGRGWMTRLASEYGECEGVEPVAGVIELARGHFPGLRFYVGTAQTLRERADFRPYDVVIASEVIEHIPREEQDDFVDAILNLLVPNGYLILTTPRREVWDRWRQVSNPAQPVEDWLKEKEVRRLMKKKGFRVIGRERVYQDIATRTFVNAGDRMKLPAQSVLALYQVWAFQAHAAPPRRETAAAVAPSEPRVPRIQPPPAAVEPAQREFRVIALVAAYNEGDIIYHVIGDLIENGVKVYLIDHCSTDNTVEEARRWLGKGLLHIERFPQDSGYPERNSTEYVWRDILRRKEELANQLRADWFIHADADEFRESPWTDMGLAEAMHYVDALGYNAINFELLNFRPIDDDFVPGTDVRLHIRYYEPGELFNATQIKAWKHIDVAVQLAQHGGHAVVFPGRRVCPVPFFVRHYPIRGETHGKRKVFKERVPRFAREERAMQWHVQYDRFLEGDARFLHDPSTLLEYDPDAARLPVLMGVSRDLLLMTLLHGAAPALSNSTLDGKAVCTWIGHILNQPRPVPLSEALQANKTLDQLLQAPAEQQKSAPDVSSGQVPILLAMAKIKAAQATLHGNRLTARRLLAFCDRLQKTVRDQ